MPILESVGSAVPETSARQSDLRDIAGSLYGERVRDVDALLAVFDNSRIDRRHFTMPLEWYVRPHGWGDRARAFVDAAVPVAEEAARVALDRARVAPEDVDAIVFVTTTGIATPSPDARLARRLGLRDDVSRLPVWGLGCAGGVAGLTRASEIATARPADRVLLVALEACSLWFRHPRFGSGAADDDREGRKSLVAASLFADGAAAALVAGDDVGADGPALGAAASHLFPDSERLMGWDVEDDGLDVVFAREIPGVVTREMKGLVDRFLKTRTDGAAPARYLFHPGGARVLAAYEEALALAPDALEDARAVLREYGNMSSPTVLFVLERALRRAPLAPGERGLLSTLGPGFASEMHLVQGR